MPVSSSQLSTSQKLSAYTAALSSPSAMGWLRLPSLGGGFGLRCFQALSSRDVAARRLRAQPVHQRSRTPVPLVLEGPSPQGADAPSRYYRTVSRRTEPSSCGPLMDEQPNPWLLLQSQDGPSRQRCTKLRGRCVLSPATSLLPPG